MAHTASSTNINISRFNAEASTWDDNPNHLKRAKLALQALFDHNILSKPSTYEHGSTQNSSASLEALEIECGTGILTFLAQPYLRSIIGVDTSQGMVDVFQRKIEHLRTTASNPEEAGNIAGVCTLFSDPDDQNVQHAISQLAKKEALAEEDLNIKDEEHPGRFDLILSLLTMHHITDHASILKTMRDSLKVGGKIALVDFEDFGPDAAFFHARHKKHGVEHHGLKREKMKDDIAAAGFKNVQVETAFVLPKKIERGGKSEDMDFPYLLCVGERA